MPTTAVEAVVAMATAQGPTITSTTWLRMMAKGGQSGPTADASQEQWAHRCDYVTCRGVRGLHMSDCPPRSNVLHAARSAQLL